MIFREKGGRLENMKRSKGGSYIHVKSQQEHWEMSWQPCDNVLMTSEHLSAGV